MSTRETGNPEQQQASVTRMENRIADSATLRSLYGQPSARSLSKVASTVTPLYKQWIDASRFVILSTSGADGTDASPRGDDGPVVEVVDQATILLPDWKGNNRLDSLQNIVESGKASLLFMVGGSENVVRINGTAYLSVDTDTIARFDKKGAQPKCVIVFSVGEVYFQCAKALMRSKLWDTGRDKNTAVPTAGDFLKESDSAFESEEYDAGYPEYAKTRLW